MPAPSADRPAPGRALEVLLAFLKLGLTSFGGPVAHLGYFREEFVTRRRWLDDRAYGDLVSLCQFLPGPASSQVGMAIGLRRAGWRGALAAWIGFTLPSAVALIAFALGVAAWPALTDSGALRGLKIAAVAVVAQAVWGMGRTLCPDRLRAGIAIGAALVVLAVPGPAAQVCAIVLGALAGRWIPGSSRAAPSAPAAPPTSRRTGLILLAVCGGLLGVLPLLAATFPTLSLRAFAVAYQAGALVFGGGHVVLPLLQGGVVPPGWESNHAFLAGYGAAQAVPGPLFTFAAYLGAVMPSPLGGWSGGLLMLVGIFLPAFLLVAGALPFWETLRSRAGAQTAMAGINAAVVGVLAAALYDPVWVGAVQSRTDFAMALTAFGLLTYARVSPVLVVGAAALLGWAMRIG